MGRDQLHHTTNRGDTLTEQPVEESVEAIDEIDEKPVKRPRKKAQPANDLGLSADTIRARAIVLGRLKSR